MANINFKVGFDVDKRGLSGIKKELNDLSEIIKKNGRDGLISKEATKKSMAEIEKLEKAMNSAFDTDTGVLNIRKLNKELKTTGTSLEGIQRSLREAGVSSGGMFQDIQREAIKTGTEIKKTTTFIDKMTDTLAQTVKWNIASGAVNAMTGQIQRAVGFVKSLDESLTQIRIVTGKSSTEMKDFANEANKAAQSLGRTTTEYTDASLIFFQQGKSADEVRSLTEATLAGANVTGMETAETAELLTAVMNGYQLEASQAMEVTDKLAAVGAATGSDFEEMAQAMSKVASQANSAGVSVDQLGAMISTVSTVTREAPTIIGTSFKTILGRLADIQNGKEVDSWDTGKVEDALNKVGMSVLDQNGKLREAGDILNELGEKWNGLNKESQVGVAKNIAGLEQYNRLVALMENWPMYQDAFNVSMEASGATMEQNSIRMDSIQSKMMLLRAETERLYMALSDEDAAKGLIGGLTTAVSKVADFAEGLGGLQGIMLALIPLATSLFSKSIGTGITSALDKLGKLKSAIQDSLSTKGGSGDYLDESRLKSSEKTALSEAKENYKTSGTESDEKQLEITKERIKLRQQEETVAKNLNETQLKQFQDAKDTLLQEQEKLKVLVKQREQRTAEAKKNVEERGMGMSKEHAQEDVTRANAELQKRNDILQKTKDLYNALTYVDSGDELMDVLTTNQALNEKSQLIRKASEDQKLLNKLGIGSMEAYNDINELQETINKSIQEQTREREEQNKELEESIRLLQDIEHLEDTDENGKTKPSEEENAAKKRADAARQEADAIDQKAIKQEKFNKAVAGIGMAAGALVAVSNSMGVLTDEAATAEEKANAVSSSLQGLGATLLASGNPWAMLAGGITMAVTAVGKWLYLNTGIHGLMKDNAEVLDNYRLKMEEIADTQDRLTSATKQLDEAERKAAEGGFSEEEMVEYKETIAQIASSTPELVSHYDSFGNAVLKSREEIEKMNDTLDEQAQKERETMRNNSDGFTEEAAYLLGDAKEREQSLNEKLISQEHKLSELRQQGASDKKIQSQKEDIEKTRGELIDIQTEIANIGPTIQETLIDPIVVGNETFQELGENAQGFVSTLVNAKDVQAEIERLSESGLYTREQIGEKIKQDLVTQKGDAEELAKSWKAVLDKAEAGDEKAQMMAETLRGLDASTQAVIGDLFSDLKDSGMFSTEEIETAMGNIANYIEDGKLSSFEMLENYESYLTQISDKLSEDLSKVKEELNTIFSNTGEEGSNLVDLGFNAETFSEYLGEGQRIYTEGAQEFAQAIQDGNVEIIQSTLENNEALREQFMTALQEKAQEKSFFGLGGATDDAEAAQKILDEIAAKEELSAKQDEINEKISTEGEIYDANIEKLWQTKEGQEEISSLWNEMVEATSEVGEGGLFSIDIAQMEEANAQLQETKENIDGTIASEEELAAANENVVSSAKKIGSAMSSAIKEMGPDKFKKIADMAGTSIDRITELADAAKKGNIDAAKSLQSEMGRIYGSMYAKDQQYFSNFRKINQDKLDLVKKATGISADNYESLSDYQAALEDRSVMVTAEGARMQVEHVKNAIMTRVENVGKGVDMEMDYNGQALDGAGRASGIAALMAAKGAVEAAKNGAKGGTDAAANLIDGLDAVNGAMGKTLGNVSSMLREKGATFDEIITYINGEIEKLASGGDKDSANDIKLDGIKLPTLDSLGVNYTPPSGNIGKPSKPSGGGGGGANVGGGGSGGGKKPSGGGSGGGKGDKGEEEKEVEDLEWEADIYRDINHQLELKERLLSELQEQQDKLYGKELLDNLAKQKKALQEQQALLEKKLEMQKQDLANQKKLLQEEAKKLGGGALEFDESGYITNYNALLEQKLKYVNSLSGEAKEAAKEEFGALVEMLEAYEDMMMNTIYESEQAIKDSIEAQREIWLQEFQYEINLQLEIHGDVKDMYDFQIETSKTAEDIAKNMERTMLLIGNEMDKIKDVHQQILAIEKDTSLTQKERLEMMSAMTDELKESVKELQKLEENMTKFFLDGLKEGLAPLEEHMKSFEKINKELKSMEQMLKLIGEGDNYEVLGNLYKEQYDAIEGQIDLLNSQKGILEREREALEAAGMKGSEEWWAVQDAIEKTDESLNKLAQDAVKNLQQQFKNATDEIMSDLEDMMTGGMGLDGLKDQNKKDKEDRKEYLDTEEKLLAVSKLQSKFQKEIDATEDPAKKAKLQKIMDEELKKLKEKDKLTKYDVDRANLIYDLTLKQMALDDQKAAKNVMRLVRDTQGNWVYEFTEDAKAVEKAQQDVSDALEKLNKLDKDRLEETQDEMIKLQEEYYKKIQQIMKDALEGKYKTEEEFNAALEETTIEFNEKMVELQERFEEAKQNATISSMGVILDVYKNTSTELEGLSEEQQEIMHKLAEAIGGDFNGLQDFMNGILSGDEDSIENTFKDMADQIGVSAEDLQGTLGKVTEGFKNDWNVKLGEMLSEFVGSGKFKEQTNKAIQEIMNKWKDYQTNLDTVTKNTNTDLDSIKDKINNVDKATEDLKNQTQGLIDKFGKYIAGIRDITTAFESQKQKIQEVIDKLKEYIQKLEEAKIKEKEEQSTNKPTPPPAPPKPPTPGGGGSSGGSGSGSDSGSGSGGNISVGSKVKLKPGQTWYYSSDGLRPIGKPENHYNLSTTQFEVTTQNQNGKYKYNVGTKKGEYLGWLNKESFVGFDTGGYTGSWGKEGKVAMLHEKEIVLNKEDTGNILEAVRAVRGDGGEGLLNKIAKTIVEASMNTIASLSGLTNSFNAQVSAPGSSQGIEQDITINADFSGVKSAEEIEKAFDNMANMASQYANRR